MISREIKEMLAQMIMVGFREAEVTERYSRYPGDKRFFPGRGDSV